MSFLLSGLSGHKWFAMSKVTFGEMVLRPANAQNGGVPAKSTL